ncbi:MAG: hypothetical protein EON53_13985 [Actinomycetales bacterium]|nr:MAG: hypothetical protein EON53_13985 [Actinomycetales bacterium]
MSGRRWVPLVLVVVTQVVGLVLVSTLVVGDDPHEAPLTIVAPAVVGQALAARADAAGTLDTSATQDRREGVDRLESGAATAVVVVDLATERDLVLVPGAQDPQLTAAVVAHVRALSASLGRSLDVEEVPPRASALDRRVVDLAPLVAVAAGMLGVAALAWWRGPQAHTTQDGVRRAAASVVLSAVVGLALAIAAASTTSGPWLGWWLVLGATTLAACAVTQALLSVLDVWGLALAVAVLLLTALPALAGTDPWQQPVAWRSVTSWLPHAAGLDAARAVAFRQGSGVATSLGVLVAWVAASFATSALARRERRRDEASSRSDGRDDGHLEQRRTS